MATVIKIFGERNTSTNALKILIEKNSKSVTAPSVASELDPSIHARLSLAKRLRIPGPLREHLIDRVFAGRGPLETWKHAATRFDDVEVFSSCHVIFCVRHPASWILGLYRRPYHVYGRTPQALRDFLDKRWRTVGRERLDRAETSATGLYNLKMATYSDLQSRLREAGVSYSIVRHEDFAVDQAKVFATLSPILASPNREFEALDASTKDSNKSRQHYQDYYGNERWRGEIDAECKARINDAIDWDAIAALGYSPS